MFRFGFSIDDTDAKPKDSTNSEESENLNWFASSEIEVTAEQVQEQYSLEDYSEIELNGVSVKLIHSEKVIESLKNDDCGNILRAEFEHSDLLPAIYEGGLKIWECSYDLAKYLLQSNDQLKEKRVLDLGCGCGLIGLLALFKGSSVHFQDYNAEVIKLVTIPNVLLNLDNRGAVTEKCKFYCGDWASFTEISVDKYREKKDKYDLIVTSETIYNSDNQKKLYEVFKRRLKHNGIGYVAGKTYYFGVGGGMRQFEALVKEDGFFDLEIVWKSTEGLQREIMMLKKSQI